MASFTSESEISAYLERVEEFKTILDAYRARERDRRWLEKQGGAEMLTVVTTAASNLLATNSVVAFSSADLSSLGAADLADVAAFSPSLEVASEVSITNNQELGVDEGDIIKRVGDYLILLRRGRLYSIDIGREPGTPIRPADGQDVFPYLAPHSAWYDELLVAGNRLIVLGYSYETGATELALFEIDRQGRIDHLESYAMQSQDYYSWENYGSRLVGGKLVFYTPIDLDHSRRGGGSIWPSYSSYDWMGRAGEWLPLVQSMEIVAPMESELPTTLHAVIECDVARNRLECSARGFLGGWDATHYVSPTATYVWVDSEPSRFAFRDSSPEQYRHWLESEGADAPESDIQDDHAMLYRLPFDDSPIGSVALSSRPINRFSFRERGGDLDLLLHRNTSQSSEHHRMEHVRIDLSRFDEDEAVVAANEIRFLPGHTGDWSCRAHRFVADHVLYASCGEGNPERPVHGVYVADLESDSAPDWIGTPSAIERVERVGENALLVGSTQSETPQSIGLDLIPVLLSADVLEASAIFLPRLTQIENRSHAFNFMLRDEDALFGLPAAYIDPARVKVHSQSDYTWYEVEGTNLITYFTMEADGRLEEVGRLVESPPAGAEPSDCETSCFDWYGSIRPFFIEGRIFGLLDYEIIEAEFRGGRMTEVQRATVLAR